MDLGAGILDCNFLAFILVVLLCFLLVNVLCFLLVRCGAENVFQCGLFLDCQCNFCFVLWLLLIVIILEALLLEHFKLSNTVLLAEAVLAIVAHRGLHLDLRSLVTRSVGPTERNVLRLLALHRAFEHGNLGTLPVRGGG